MLSKEAHAGPGLLQDTRALTCFAFRYKLLLEHSQGRGWVLGPAATAALWAASSGFEGEQEPRGSAGTWAWPMGTLGKEQPAWAEAGVSGLRGEASPGKRREAREPESLPVPPRWRLAGEPEHKARATPPAFRGPEQAAAGWPAAQWAEQGRH